MTHTHDAERLRAAKRTLIHLLTQQGVTGARVAVTSGHSGPRAVWASIPLGEATHLDHDALTGAGYVVTIGTHTVSVLTGEAV